MITLLVFNLIIVVFLSMAGHPPSLWALAAFSGYCAALAAMVVGFSLRRACCFRYRDLNQVWEVVIQASSSSRRSLSARNPARALSRHRIWPPTPVIEFSRSVLINGVLPTATGHLYLAADAALCLLAGVLFFWRLSPRAAEYV